jgi:hypothetical protein
VDEKKNQTTLSDYLALAINSIYTYHIYVSNTPEGTGAQADFVTWFTLLGLVFAIFCSMALTDATILAADSRVGASRYIGRMFFVVQVLMFALFAQFWLMTMRIIGVALLWSRTKQARERAKKTSDTSGAA